jgi:hypothetical protein
MVVTRSSIVASERHFIEVTSRNTIPIGEVSQTANIEKLAYEAGRYTLLA